MKTRFLLMAVVSGLTALLYLMMPGCGNQSNNQPYSPYGAYGTTCIPGQLCTTGLGGVNGVPLVPGVVMASIDSYGSIAQMQIGGSSVVAGQQYSGAATITGVIQMAPGGVCPPGAYQLQGTGEYSTSGGIPQIQAQLQITGPMGTMQGMISGNIFTGQDSYAPQMQSQYYFRGQFGTSCNPGGIAL